MTLEELNASFIACLAKKTTYDPVKRQPKRPRRDNSYQHILYPIQQLAALTAVLRTVDDDACKYSVRYLVTTEGKLLFAQEGLPGFSIPKHRQIREKCLAAGNVYFSDDYKSITKINHCSGDFHPSADSLIWPIAALYLLKAPIAVPFTVETSSVNPQGVFTVEASYSLELKQIDDLLSAEMKTHILSFPAFQWHQQESERISQLLEFRKELQQQNLLGLSIPQDVTKATAGKFYRLIKSEAMR